MSGRAWGVYITSQLNTSPGTVIREDLHGVYEGLFSAVSAATQLAKDVAGIVILRELPSPNEKPQ
jgi:hypothetical protein